MTVTIYNNTREYARQHERTRSIERSKRCGGLKTWKRANFKRSKTWKHMAKVWTCTSKHNTFARTREKTWKHGKHEFVNVEKIKVIRDRLKKHGKMCKRDEVEKACGKHEKARVNPRKHNEAQEKIQIIQWKTWQDGESDNKLGNIRIRDKGQENAMHN